MGARTPRGLTHTLDVGLSLTGVPLSLPSVPLVPASALVGRTSSIGCAQGRVDGLYIVLISLHGLIRGAHMELGRDADTGGQARAHRPPPA